MGVSVSLLLIAAGLVLLLATTLNAIGWILLIVGIVGIVLSMIFWSSWAGPGYFGGSRRRTTYVDEGPGGPAPY